MSAGEHEGPHVARRHTLEALKYGVRDVDGALFDYVLVGLRSLRWGGRDEVLGALSQGDYGVVARRGEFVLLGRGSSTTQNSAVAKWVRAGTK